MHPVYSLTNPFARLIRCIPVGLIVGLLSSCASPPVIDHDALEKNRLQRELVRQTQLERARYLAYEAAMERARRAGERARQPRPAASLVASMRSGQYQCDLSRSVELKHVDMEDLSAVLRWQGQDYPMQAVRAATGALRLEDPQAGLVWLTILGKSILLNSRNGRQLANDCNHVS